MNKLLLSFFAMACALLVNTAQAQDDMRIAQVRFAAGATGTTISDRITGRDSVLYKIGAEAGQTMSISLTSNSTATYFNVYAPGSGPGDQALAVSEMIGPMVPDTNRFSGALPISGEYTVSVYLFRNAARRGDTSEYTIDFSITGEPGETVQGDYADGLQGGPDYWAVQTGGGPLNLRQEPSAGADIITGLLNGTPVRNLGCRMAEGRRWCRVATLSDPGFDGWAAGDFLIEGNGEGAAVQLPDAIPVASGDALVPGTEYNATGMIPCARDGDAPDQNCAFGVKRQGNGTGALTVDWPGGGSRVLFFEDGTPVSFDASQADGDAQMTVTRDGDNSIVFVGQERFVIPDAVIWGG